MPTIFVEVMPKAEILDPQGKAVAGALLQPSFHELKIMAQGNRIAAV